MKRLFTFIMITALASCMAMAQRALMIKRANGVTDAVSTALIDSLEFSEDGSMLKIASKDGQLIEIETMGISLAYGEMPSTFTVIYKGATASVVNPFLLDGVRLKSPALMSRSTMAMSAQSITSLSRVKLQTALSYIMVHTRPRLYLMA